MNFYVYLVEVKGYTAVTCLHLCQAHLQAVKKKWVQKDYYTDDTVKQNRIHIIHIATEKHDEIRLT